MIQVSHTPHFLKSTTSSEASLQDALNQLDAELGPTRSVDKINGGSGRVDIKKVTAKPTMETVTSDLPHFINSGQTVDLTSTPCGECGGCEILTQITGFNLRHLVRAD